MILFTIKNLISSFVDTTYVCRLSMFIKPFGFDGFLKMKCFPVDLQRTDASSPRGRSDRGQRIDRQIFEVAKSYLKIQPSKFCLKIIINFLLIL